jgi:oligopeptide transport system permease protein
VSIETHSTSFWRRLRAHRSAFVCLWLLAFIILAAIMLPLLLRYDYATPDWDRIFEAPQGAGGHWLGTDSLGRDLLVRVLWGCRISLAVGIAASLVSVAIGSWWGITAGYCGGRIDAWMMRAVDVLYTIPFVPLVIVLSVLFGRSFILVFIAIGCVSWLDIARIVRAQTQSLCQQDFVDAARTLGLSTTTMIRRHLLPNLAGTVAVNATLTVPTVILFEALLSFLGLGVRAPLASLGTLVAEGVNHLQSHPYVIIAPALLLALILFCCNQIGDGLRDALASKAERR